MSCPASLWINSTIVIDLSKVIYTRWVTRSSTTGIELSVHLIGEERPIMFSEKDGKEFNLALITYHETRDNVVNTVRS